jgi:hypothetical protein
MGYENPAICYPANGDGLVDAISGALGGGTCYVAHHSHYTSGINAQIISPAPTPSTCCDTLPASHFDSGDIGACEAMLQGSNRIQRGLNMMAFLAKYRDDKTAPPHSLFYGAPLTKPLPGLAQCLRASFRR